MKRYLLLGMISIWAYVLPYPLFSQQNHWIDSNQPISAEDHSSMPDPYRALTLDVAAFKTELSTAPLESATAVQALSISLPMPDGSIHQFQIVKSPIMEAGLAAKFPMIQNYVGKGIDDPTATLRISVSHKGVRCLLRSDGGMVLIEPVSRQAPHQYICYSVADLPKDEIGHSICGTVADALPSIQRSVPQAIGQELLTYRLAVSSSATYTQFAGGTVADAIAEINSVVSQVNVAMERDLAIRLVLVNNNDQLVFLPGQNDPFTDDPNFAVNNLQANHDFITATIGSGAFDIGHVFIRIPSQQGTFVAGIASVNSVCRNNLKGRGASSAPNPGNFGFVETTIHEIGHQFSARHSFNSVTGGCSGNRTGSHAYEPGSGSTIMAYSSCGPDNLIGGTGYYFHADAIESIVNYTRTAQGGNCPVTTSLGNQSPAVEAGTGSFVIPISTPFELTGVASDPDGDSLTYCWEQFDLGPAGAVDMPSGNAPIFRSFNPTNSPTRIFPQLTDILNNDQTKGELLPTYSRDLTFRLTVRDQNGGVNADDIFFEATEDAGPFEVLVPNTSATYTSGYPLQVLWDVANTDQAPVNCTQVDILLSEDGGQTFPYILADDVPNNGAATITIPDVPTSFARIKVKASNNIFFNISDEPFTIELPAAPGFVLFPEIDTVTLCGIVDLTLPIYSVPLLGFADDFNISVQSLPPGVSGSFVNDVLSPGDTAYLQLSTTDTLPAGSFPIAVLAFSASGPSDALIVQLEIGAPVLPEQVMAISPGSQTGIAPNTSFSWHPLPDVTSYTLQVASNPGFGSATIVNISGIEDTSYTLTSTLAGESVYYWRVKGDSPCGSGPFSIVGGFQTGICNSSLSVDVPLNIPTFGAPSTVSSTFASTLVGNVASVKVIDLMGTHSAVSQLEMSLTSPSGTTVNLFSGICSPTDANFELNFEDGGEPTIPCPPVEDGAYQPMDSLSQFIGEFAFGLWTLTVTDLEDFDNGQVTSWGLEMCVSGLPGPLLINNQPLNTTQWFQETITSNQLQVQDAGSQASQLIYTVVSLPEYGGLLVNGNNIAVGETFTQEDIDQSRLAYLNNGSASSVDSFRFDVVNSGGGWIGVYTFQITIDAGVSSISSPSESLTLSTYPNPAKGELFVELSGADIGQFELKLLTINGQEIVRRKASMQGTKWSQALDLSDVASGLYFLHLTSEVGILTTKIIIDQ